MLETVKTSPQPALDHAAHLAARLHDLRAGRNWSLEALSRACGVSRSMLSQIERNRVNPTLAVTLSIARAFGLSIGEFLEMPSASPALHVIRKNDREYHYRSDKDCRIRTLSPLNLEKDVEFYEVTLEPKGALRSAPHFPGTREFLTVQKGRVRVESGPDSEVLAAGDSVSYRADVPHVIANPGSRPAVLFLVDIYLD
ncbi:MAG: helix-turn-helix transcriptional regulator [Candidatus Solibacter usitatus]|nr:helix-turn-helix transcriptional regulator [Candidatus Solibacter usitatus]